MTDKEFVLSSYPNALVLMNYFPTTYKIVLENFYNAERISNNTFSEELAWGNAAILLRLKIEKRFAS